MRISDWSSDVCSSDLRPAITEEAEGGAVAAHPIKFDRRDQNARLLAAEVLDIVPPLVGNEAVAVEGLPVLGADAVGGDHGHDIGHAVAHHRALPHAAGVEVGVVRLVADGGGEDRKSTRLNSSH